MTKLNACPLLQSVVAKVLMLNITAVVNSEILLYGHRDQWNTGRKFDNGKQGDTFNEFWIERFLRYPNVSSSGSSKKSNIVILSEKLSNSTII